MLMSDLKSGKNVILLCKKAYCLSFIVEHENYVQSKQEQSRKVKHNGSQ